MFTAPLPRVIILWTVNPFALVVTGGLLSFLALDLLSQLLLGDPPARLSTSEVRRIIILHWTLGVSLLLGSGPDCVCRNLPAYKEALDGLRAAGGPPGA